MYVLLGTLYPIAIDAILNTKLSVGPPYFNAIFIPFVSLLFIVMGIAPHIKWMKDTANQYVRLVVMWTAMSVALSVLLPIIFNWGLKPKLVLGLFLSLWLVVTTLALSLKRLKNKNLDEKVIRLEHFKPGGQLKAEELEEQFTEQVEESEKEKIETLIRAIGQAESREMLNNIWNLNSEFMQVPAVTAAMRKAAAKYPKQQALPK